MQSYCNKTHFTYNLVWAIWVYSGKGNHAHVKEQVKLHFALVIGGLGSSNLQNLNWALQMRWIWLQETEANHPWSAFAIQVHGCVWAFFSHGRLAVVSEVGNVTSTLFWSFGLIDGCTDSGLLILHPGCLHLCRRGELIRGLSKRPLWIIVECH